MPSWRALWATWLRIAHAIGAFQTRLILTVLYFVVVGPLALVVRLVSDPLAIRRQAGGSHWLPRITREATIETLRRQ